MKKILFGLMVFCTLKAYSSEQFPKKFAVEIVSKDGKRSQRQVYELHNPKKAWKICVSLPNSIDPYWWTVSFGLKQAENILGVNLVIKDAGGYNNLDAQKRHLRECLNQSADAVIIAAISSTALEDEILMLSKQGIPVIDLVNGIQNEHIKAKSLVSFKDMARVIAEYINQSYQIPSKEKMTIAWFPGPKDAGWSQDGDSGFLQYIDKNKFTIIHGGFAATDPLEQRTLLEKVLKVHSPDILVGNAVFASLVARLHKANPKKVSGKIYSYYLSQELADHLQRGEILAAPTDFPAYQAIIAVDQATRILEKSNTAHQVSPKIEVVNPQNYSEMLKKFIIHPTHFRHYIKSDF